MPGSAPKLSLFDYDNYREFLRDRFAMWKKEKRNFSYRYFAKLCGMQAHSFIIRNLQGKVDLSEESIEKFAVALKLNKDESIFFRNLVFFNQAKSSEDKRHFAKEILRIRTYRKVNPLKQSHFRFYDNWYYPPIRELVCLDGFREDPEWIAKKVMPAITVAEAKRALEDLILLGLLKRNDAGRLTQAESIISTEDEVTSSAIAQYHREMMKLAAESIDRIPREQRAIMAQTFGVSGEGAQKIKELIQRFRQEVFEVISGEHEPDAVYQLNFQLFPLALPNAKGLK
jgi:uncharacterized protein (TIGR02147 family)